MHKLLRTGLGASVFVALAFLVLVGAGHAKDGTATDALRKHFDVVLSLLKAEKFVALDADQRRAELRELSGRLFAWSEMSQRALGPVWKERTAQERRAYTDDFTRLVEGFYIGRLEDLDVSGISSVPVQYLGESTAGRSTIVATRLNHRRDLPVDFWMVHRRGRWRVVDMVVEGVSAVENYRAQFQRVVAREGYPELVNRMSPKARALRETGTTAASP